MGHKGSETIFENEGEIAKNLNSEKEIVLTKIVLTKCLKVTTLDTQGDNLSLSHKYVCMVEGKISILQVFSDLHTSPWYYVASTDK